MKTIIKYSPTLLAAIILFLTVKRVSSYVEEGTNTSSSNANVFALTIFFGILVCSYLGQKRTEYTRKGVTKETVKGAKASKSARTLLYIFIAADGVFNLAEVNMNLEIVFWSSDWFIFLVAQIFGILPTILAAGLGILQSHVDQLPPSVFGAKKGADNKNLVEQFFVAWIERIKSYEKPTEVSQKVRRATKATKKETKKVVDNPFPCECGRSFGTQNGLNSHKGKCRLRDNS